VSEATDKLDEFGRWNIADLKGAVERMKALIDEQEKRSQGSSGRGHARSKNSISLNDTPPTRNTPLPSKEDSVQHFGSLRESGEITPRRRLPDAILATDGDRNEAKRKESHVFSSATATSTAVVTPIAPHDEPSFPLKKDTGHERVESFDFASLDPDLVAMLSPNHMLSGQVESSESGECTSDILVHF
jgi:hypothetical protein